MACFIDIHTHHEVADLHIRSFRLGIDSVVYGACSAAAVHPWDAASVDAERWVDELAELIKSQKVGCIAETGLDFVVSVDRARQKTIFERQLALSKTLNVPVFVHSVKANDEVYNVLRQFVPLRCVVHGFVGNEVQAQKFIDLGVYLSVSCRSLQSPKTVRAIEKTPIERLFCESDDHPTDVSEVYARLAVVKRTDIETLKQTIEMNYKQFFI